MDPEDKNACDWLDDESDTTCCFDDEPCDYGEEDDAPCADEPVSLAPAAFLAGKSPIAKLYNRIGGCVTRLAAEYDLEVSTVLAIFLVESGPFAHVPGKAIIRFENHLFYKAWGKFHPGSFKSNYKLGGGKPWLGHEFLYNANWVGTHSSQAVEYAALARATALAGEDVALCCISIGGPQILVRNHALIGYATPKAMWDAFQGSEETHVRGLLDFLKAKGLLEAARNHDDRTLARGYNGPGQVDLYAPKIAKARALAKSLISAS